MIMLCIINDYIYIEFVILEDFCLHLSALSFYTNLLRLQI